MNPDLLVKNDESSSVGIFGKIVSGPAEEHFKGFLLQNLKFGNAHFNASSSPDKNLNYRLWTPSRPAIPQSVSVRREIPLDEFVGREGGSPWYIFVSDGLQLSKTCEKFTNGGGGMPKWFILTDRASQRRCHCPPRHRYRRR